MSVRATTWVWEQPMPPSEKIVLLRLADHANPDGGDVYPSIASVAEYTGISERQVQRYIKGFVERGILVITGHAKGGRSNPREYQFTFQFAPRKGDTRDTVSDAERVTPPTPIAARKGDADDTVSERVTSTKGDTEGTERVTPMTLKGDTAMSPEPSRTVKEPSFGKTPRTSSRKKPEVPIPDGFTLTDGRLNYAINEGMDASRARYEFERMRNWAQSKDMRRSDWDAQWRNWVLKDIRDNGKSATPDRPTEWRLNASGVMVEVPR